jgi:hypothetical protein
MLKKIFVLLACIHHSTHSTITILAPLDHENLDQALKPHFQRIPAVVRAYYAHGGPCFLTPLYATCYKNRDPFIQIRRELIKRAAGQNYEVPEEAILQALALSRKTNWTGSNPATILHDPQLALHQSHNDDDNSITYSYYSGPEVRHADHKNFIPNPLVIKPL